MLTYADVCYAETAEGRQAAGEKILDEPDRRCRVRLPPGCVVKLAVKLAVKLVVNLVVKLEVLLDDPDRQGHIANMAGRGCHSAAAPHTLVG
jgi:hypothetical protein